MPLYRRTDIVLFPKRKNIPSAPASTIAHASGTVPFPSFGAAGTAKAVAKATAPVPFPLFGVAATAQSKAKATGIIPFPPFGASASASTGGVHAQGNVPFPAFGATGTAKAVSRAIATIPFAAIGASGAAKALSKAIAVVPFPNFGASGAGVSKARAVGLIPFPLFGVIAVARVTAHAQGVIPFPSFGATGTAGQPIAETPVSTHYASQIAMALRLIAAKGTTATLRHYPDNGPAIQDRVRGVVSDDGHVDYLITVVILPMPVQLRGAGGRGDLRLEKKRKLLIAGASCPVTPSEGDRMLDLEGVTWTFTQPAEPLGPDGVKPILFTAVIDR